MLPVFLILCVAWYVLWIPTEKYEARLNTSMIALLALIAYNFVFEGDIATAFDTLEPDVATAGLQDAHLHPQLVAALMQETIDIVCSPQF